VKRWLLLLPLVVIAIVALTLLALPAYLASATNRPTVEALASSLTGRQVRITGPLAVTLLPSPEVTAQEVTITGPAGETITTSALTLDLSGPALLRGRLAARMLTLTDPVIALPWPLPGGARGISPPGWLATLHAAIVNGRMSLGPLAFTGVNADIYTDNGAVTLSGNGNLAGAPAALTLALQRQGLDGTAPLSLDATAGRLTLHVTGALNAASTLAGTLSFKAGDISGQGTVTADAQQVASSALTLRRDGATLAGTAALHFAPLRLSAMLSGDGIDISNLPALSGWPIPAVLVLGLTHARIFGHSVPAASLTLDVATNGGVRLNPVLLNLPGQGVLTATIARTPAGALSGHARLTAADMTALLAYLELPPMPDWTDADLSARVSGTAQAVSLQDIQGRLGHDRLTGTLVVTADHADGALAFSHLDLLALTPWLTPGAGSLDAEGEITAAAAALGPLDLNNLLIDGAVGRTINIRRFSATLGAHGLLAGSLALHHGLLQGALLVELPTATVLAPLVASLTGWDPPAALLSPRLALNAAALGPVAALSTSAVATLGDFTLTATPTIDLVHGAGAGALTVQNPNAIRALSIFNLNRGLDWPGAGSLSLRANAVDTADSQGLADFILSLGRLQASGRLLRQKGVFNGTIDASNLDLRRWPAGAASPWAAISPLTGKLTLRADTLSLERRTLLSPLDAAIDAVPGKLTLTLNPSGLAGGTLQGQAIALTADSKPPALTATLKINNLDASQIAQPSQAPLSLATGTLTGTASLTATGYSPLTWEDTLGGTLTLNATNGTLASLSLPDLTTALTRTKPKTRARQTALNSALTTGVTAFPTASLTATVSDGTLTLTAAALTSPNGTITAAGTADIPDNAIDIRLTTTPNPGAPIVTVLTGPWPTPRATRALGPALGWGMLGESK
jgi:uncharacterized protein involved in outer membrane biogenesis